MANDFFELKDLNDNPVFINITQIATATFYTQSGTRWVSLVMAGLGQAPGAAISSANRLSYSGDEVKRLENILSQRAN